MVANKTSRFAYDWWIIQKRFVYLVIAIFMLCGLAAGAAVYVYKYGNPFRNVAVVNQPAGARFVSFPDCSHWWQLELPDGMADELRRFW